jgi:hypothetical protein
MKQKKLGLTTGDIVQQCGGSLFSKPMTEELGDPGDTV